VSVVLAGLACRPQGSGSPTGLEAGWVAEAVGDLGPVVARVGANPIFAAEVRAQAERSGKPPRAALDEIVAFHLLAERARERGLAAKAGGEVPSALLVQRFVEREFEPSVEPEDLSDAELRALYAKFRDRYVHPRIVRVALLSVYPRKAQPKETAYAAARATGQALIEHVARRPDRTDEDFARIQQDPAWTSRNVSFARVWQGPDQAFGPLGAGPGGAIARLRRPGDTTPLIEDRGAYHIARYIEEMPARNVSFEQAREELSREYYPRWRRERFERFTGRFVEQHQIEAHLDRVLAKAPSR
jgi:hypothetical protein